METLDTPFNMNSLCINSNTVSKWPNKENYMVWK